MMNWNTLISAKRFGLEEFHQERHENRSEFQRDYDRLVFSAPFRRLQNKTQVFPLPGSIFVHNRLTHSLEVSCVGRSLGTDVAKAILARQPELQNSYLPEIGSIVSAASPFRTLRRASHLYVLLRRKRYGTERAAACCTMGRLDTF